MLCTQGLRDVNSVKSASECIIMEVAKDKNAGVEEFDEDDVASRRCMLDGKCNRYMQCFCVILYYKHTESSLTKGIV